MKTYHQENSLHDWVCNSGQGIMGINSPEELPWDMIEFIKAQYQRFKITAPPDDVITIGAYAMFYTVDTIDPYALLCGLSDVEVSQAWSEMYFEMVNARGTGEPAKPEQLETFVYKPGQDEAVFNHMMAHPGLQAIPYGIGNNIEDVLNGEYYGDDWYGIGCVDSLTDESKEWLLIHCGKDRTKMKAYFELAAWAGLAWLIGPYGRDFRYSHHYVFDAASKTGEAIMYEGYVLSQEHYRKFARLPESCVQCGIQKYCVELSYIDGHTRFICEHHMNGPAMYAQATCGSRICRAVDCVNHPAYGQSGGLMDTMRRTGQLMAHNRKENLALADDSKLLLTN